MKKFFLIACLTTFMHSCGLSLEQQGYNFDNFKETPLWELAQAVRADDASKVEQILKDKKLEVDLKEPKYHQTLLALAIQNKKKNAFLELLKAGANPNKFLGELNDATPFVHGIRNVENCDLFYVEAMLKYGANPNLEIKNPTPEYYFTDSYPLFVAIGNRYNLGVECLDLIKLLVDNGANINCCYQQTDTNLCEGVLSRALTQDCMETLRYFVIEKKIPIPDTVIITGVQNSTRKAYGLKEELISKYHKYEDFEMDGQKFDRSNDRKIRDEILEYLDKIGK